jgi:hypothetical protein
MAQGYHIFIKITLEILCFFNNIFKSAHFLIAVYEIRYILFCYTYSIIIK